MLLCVLFTFLSKLRNRWLLLIFFVCLWKSFRWRHSQVVTDQAFERQFMFQVLLPPHIANVAQYLTSPVIIPVHLTNHPACQVIHTYDNILYIQSTNESERQLCTMPLNIMLLTHHLLLYASRWNSLTSLRLELTFLFSFGLPLFS